MIGLELHTDISLTGSLCLWFSVILSLGGFGLTLRALEARFGRLSLNHYHGLYEHSPTLAVCFLLTGLASVGFPCTIGFISTELLVDGAVEVSSYVGIAVITRRCAQRHSRDAGLFLTLHRSTTYIDCFVGDRPERTDRGPDPLLLILAGGLYPQPGVTSRERAAEAILQERSFGQAAPSPVAHGEAAKAEKETRPLSASTWMPRAIIDMAPAPELRTNKALPAVSPHARGSSALWHGLDSTREQKPGFLAHGLSPTRATQGPHEIQRKTISTCLVRLYPLRLFLDRPRG